MNTGHLFLFAVSMLWVWLLWLLRVVLAGQYRPVDGPFVSTTSVIAPVVDEPIDVFQDVFGADRRSPQRARWLLQHFSTVIRGENFGNALAVR